MELPVEQLRADLFGALDRGASRFVISAPTGSGKSTALPVMIQRRLGGQVFVLQPRRVAARMLARSIEKMFSMKGEAGWHIRFEKNYTRDTKIVFLTEGILARMLISGSLPENVSAIIFDEFHERNIFTDISLALALKLAEKSGRDLKLFACSASIDTGALASYMKAEVLECSSRLFNVDIKYSDLMGRNLPIWEVAAREAARAAERSCGNILVFMPGIYEITKTISKMLEIPRLRKMRILPLYGEMPSAAQDEILSPSPQRKVIVSTNIAETSLTIEGVDCVVDSGLAKILRYDAARGVNTLLVERISLASATQRAGRAGRLRDGAAIRLWRPSEERGFAAYTEPEIRRVDLSQTLLWLKAGGLETGGINLFEPPPPQAVDAAENLLKMLGAADEFGNITALGAKMARFPSSPRLARLFAEAAKRGCAADAAFIAAVQESGRIKLDIDDDRRSMQRASLLSAPSQPLEEVELSRLAKANSFSADFCGEYGIHAANARRAFVFAADYLRLCKSAFREFSDRAEVSFEDDGGKAVSECVLSAYPDRVCKRLSSGLVCRKVGGETAQIRKSAKDFAKDLFVAMSLQQTNTASGVQLVADDIVPVGVESLRELFPGDFSHLRGVDIDQSQRRVCVSERICFRDLPLSQKISYDVPAGEAAELLYSKIQSGEIKLKNFGDQEREFIERVNFFAAAMPEMGVLPIDDEGMGLILRQMCEGLYSYSEVRNADVMSALRQWLSAEQLAAMDSYAPKAVEISPKRRPVKIRYSAAPLRAVVSASFKDLFSFNADSLKICGGRVRVTYEILAPNSRPVQTTQDLKNFWKTSWEGVRKEMKARYPKHFKSTDPW